MVGDEDDVSRRRAKMKKKKLKNRHSRVIALVYAVARFTLLLSG